MSDMVTIENRMKASKRTREELEYNIAWRDLVVCRCQWEGFKCKITPETQIILDGGSLRKENWQENEGRLRDRAESLRSRLGELTTAYQFARVNVERSLGRALTDDEMLRGFGRPIPDGALPEARPWDKNYCPPGFPWKEFLADAPEPEKRWRTLADRMREVGEMPEDVLDPDDIRIGVEPPTEPARLAMLQRRPLENQLNDLRILYGDEERKMKTAKWNEKERIRKAMQQLLHEARMQVKEEGGGDMDGYQILFPTTEATTGNLPVASEGSEKSEEREDPMKKPPQKEVLFPTPADPAPLTPRLSVAEQLADLRRSYRDAQAALAGATTEQERAMLRDVVDGIEAEGKRLRALEGNFDGKR